MHEKHRQLKLFQIFIYQFCLYFIIFFIVEKSLYDMLLTCALQPIFCRVHIPPSFAQTFLCANADLKSNDTRSALVILGFRIARVPYPKKRKKKEKK